MVHLFICCFGCSKRPLTVAEASRLQKNEQDCCWCTAVSLHATSVVSWYVSETLVGLSLFDDKVDNETKVSMVTALECASADKPSKRILMEEKDSVISSKKLNEFVTLTLVLSDQLHLL